MKTIKLFSKVKWLVVTCLMLLTISPQVWATSGTITAASTTDLGKGNTPRYVVEQAGVGRLMKNSDGSSSWSVSDGKLATGSSKFALQTYNAISSIVINGYGTGSNRTFSSMKVGTTTSNYAAASATGSGTMSSTAESQTITITPASTIAANSYVEITLSGNVNIFSVELVYAGGGGGGDCTSHSVNLSSSGSVTGGTFTTSSATVCEGETATLTATPAAGYVFTSWSASGTGSSLSSTTTNPTTLTMGTADVSVNATFTKVYASGTYTFYGNTTVGSSPSKTVSTTETSYDAFRIDNLFFSDTKIQFESGTGSTESNDYYGWKVKKSSTIKFFVEEDSDVKICIGTIGGGTCTVSYTDHSSVVHNNTSISSGSHETYEVKGGTMVTLSMAPSSNKSVTLKQIIISASSACSAPTTTFANGSYTIGGSALDLSTLIGSNNSSGAITYTVKNANGTGASISTASFTATTAGTCTVTATQAANGDKCEKVMDATITVNATPSISSFSPASGSTIKSGTTITVSGSSSSTVYCLWASSTPSASDVKGGTAGTSGAAAVTSAGIASANGTTLYAVATRGGATSSISSASYTIDDTAPTLSSSNPANGATGVATSGTIVLTFSEAIANVDGSKFTLTGATKGAVAKDGSNNTKVNIAYSGAANSATVTLATAAGAVSDAAGNTSAALSNISFTTVAAATYTVTYDGSSNDDGTVPEDGTSYSSGATVTVLGNTGSLTRSIEDCDATFLGWNTNSDMYSGTHYDAGDKFEIAANTTLYAVWGFNITYTDEDKETEITGLEPTYYIYGEGATLPTPTKSGYTFDGWYNAWCVESGCSGPCGFDNSCKRTEIGDDDYCDAEYYAKWTPNSCTDAELAYGTTEVAKTYGDAAFTNTLTNSHSVSVTYSSTNTSVATVDSYGEVTIKTAGNATIKATLSGDATYCDEEVSYTLTVSKANLAGTASTGTASSVTHNSASLPFTISTSTDGIESMTIKVYAGESLAKTYSDITPASSGSYSATDLSASTTYTYTITLIGDANHNNKAETSKSTSFTTGATPTLTALVAGTLYEVPDMIPSGESLSNSDQFFEGLSANTKFELIGSASSSTTPKVNNNSSNDRTIDGITFDDGSMWFKGEASLTSNIPTTFGLSFIVPGTGKLYLYFDNDDTSTNIKLAKSGATGAKPTVSSGYAVVDVTEGTYYMYGTGTTSPYSFYGLKFVTTYAITLHDNNGGEHNGSAKVEANGKTLLDISAPTRTGYDVEGYYGEAGCTTKIATAAGALQASKSVSEVEYTNSSSQWTKGSGATLYAKWTPAVYNITYKDCGDVAFSGVHGDGYPTTHTYGSTTALVNPSKDGATFLGWFTDAAGTSSAGGSIGATAKTANFTLYAKWGTAVNFSNFYALYALEEKTRDQLISAASMPSYIISTITVAAANVTFASAPTLTTPYDFSVIGTTKAYHIKTANTNTIVLMAVSNVKTIRFYGYASDKTVTATAINQSGGSNLSISSGSVTGSVIAETSFDIAGASGYSSSDYYTLTFTFPGDVHLFGVYVETGSVYSVTDVELDKSELELIIDDTEQLTATITPVYATDKVLSWESSDDEVATVSSGLVTAVSAGTATITVTTHDGSYTATCDVTVEAFDCNKYVGKIFDLTVTTSSKSFTIGNGTEQNLSSDATIMADCSAYMGKLGSSTSTSCISSTKLKLDVSSNADKYVKISTKCALRNGDVISCTGSSQELAFSTTATKVSTPATTSYSYTVTPGDGLAGASTIYVWGASSSATVSTLTITRPTSYVLTYNVNGGRAESAPDADRFAAGANLLTTGIPLRSGYVFKGWTEDAEGDETLYKAGAVYTMPSSAKTLYAQWKTPEIDDAYASVTMTAKNTASAVNGTALVSNVGQSSDDDASGYKLNASSNCYFGLTLANGNFKVGDKLVIDFVAKGTTLDLCKASDGASFHQVTVTNNKDYKGNDALVVEITSAMIETNGLTNTVAIKRTGSSPFTIAHFVRSIKVKRDYCDGCMALKDGETEWSTTASDWIGQHGVAEAVPTSDDVVFIDKAITISAGVTAQAAEVIIGESGSINIAATGGLIVEGGIRQSGDVATDASDIVINTSASGQGLLIFDNPSAGNQATINMYSKANKAGSTRNWQYMAIPIQEASVSDFFYGVGTYTYKHIEAQGGWVRYGLGTTLNAFDGIGLTQEEVTDYTFYGTLVSTANHTYSVTNVKKGNNIVGNSWPAPINLKALSVDDFTNVELDIAIYNTGSDNKSAWTTGTSTEAGTWDHVPLSLVGGVFANDWAGTTVIPAFQAFQLKATGAGSVTIDYDRCVRDTAAGHTNDALRAPSRRGTLSDDKQLLRLAVQDTIGIDYIYLIEGSEFTEGYDNGWEADYSKGIRFGKLYALDAESNKKMALARPDLEGTMVGFVPGVSNIYTITFNQTEGYYYLNDLKKEESTLIQKGNSYTFTVEEGDAAERFMISATPFAKTNPTGIEEMENGKWKMENAKKVLIDDHLYIIRAGKVFDATGGRVK